MILTSPPAKIGHTNNAIVDIQGVIGELILFDHLSRHLSEWSVSPFLLDWRGGASTEASSRADLELVLESEAVDARKVLASRPGDTTVTRPPLRELIEAKCHLDLEGLWSSTTSRGSGISPSITKQSATLTRSEPG